MRVHRCRSRRASRSHTTIRHDEERDQTLVETLLARARRLVGLKGYVTNIPADLMPAAEVLASYHDLWQVEASFRMSKTHFRARPIFHHTRESIEAHLTIVFAGLTLPRHFQKEMGMIIKKIVQTLRPLRDVTISIAAQTVTARPAIPAEIQAIIKKATH